MSAQENRISDLGWKLILVHREPCGDFDTLLTRNGFDQAEHVEDTHGDLYAAFGLGSGRLSELLPPKVWWRGFRALLKGFLPGKPGKDVRQMAGAFIVERGKITSADRAKNSSDLPNLDRLIIAAGI